MSNHITRVKAYVQELDMLTMGTFGGGNLGRISKLASNILESGQKFTDRQIETLEGICEKIELYRETGRKFSEKHKPELLENYEATQEIFESHPDRSDKQLTVQQGFHKHRLNTLRQGKMVYPFHISNLYFCLKFLEKHRYEVAEFIEQATELRSSYWEIFEELKSQPRN